MKNEVKCLTKEEAIKYYKDIDNLKDKESVIIKTGWFSKAELTCDVRERRNIIYHCRAEYLTKISGWVVFNLDSNTSGALLYKKIDDSNSNFIEIAPNRKLNKNDIIEIKYFKIEEEINLGQYIIYWLKNI